ncbi:MAG: 2-hydroxyacid dehydrogenase [Acidimicrobiia bacterium]
MKIVITRAIDLSVLDLLGPITPVMWPDTSAMPAGAFRAEMADADGVITSLTDQVDVELLAASPLLRVVSQVAVGVDNIDLEACTARGIPVGNTPDVLTETTADTAWALLSAVVRRLPEGRDHVLAGEWGPWRPDLLLGGDLHGTTLGVVGLGRIGAAVARRAAGFSMRVLYSSRSRKPHLEADLKVSYRAFEALLSESDHVVITVPLTPDTRGLVDDRALALMKQTATLVNVSRGPVVDTDALVRSLATGGIGAAALDVTDPEPLPGDHPLLGFPNCTVIPHLGSASHRTRAAMLTLAVENLAAGLEGERMSSCANQQVYADE